MFQTAKILAQQLVTLYLYVFENSREIHAARAKCLVFNIEGRDFP